jgi:hypothetical protein
VFAAGDAISAIRRDQLSNANALGHADGKRHCAATDQIAMPAIAATATAPSTATPAAASDENVDSVLARRPASTIRRPARAITRSSATHAPIDAATMTSCSDAAAAAGNHRRRSGSPNQRTASTASVGGLPGPRISATSTTDSEYASTARNGRRTCGHTCGSTTRTHASAGP